MGLPTVKSNWKSSIPVVGRAPDPVDEVRATTRIHTLLDWFSNAAGKVAVTVTLV